LSLRRNELTWLAVVLAGAVLAIDLLWGAVEGSTGSFAYGLIDEPAHLATCALALLALAAVTGSGPTRRFVLPALVASIAIDADHIPGYLGSHALAGGLPRPYPHSLLLVGALMAVGLISRRRDLRYISFGLAFGVSAHLLRDLATGPGVPLLWPLSDGVARLPYAFFAGLLLAAAMFVLWARPRDARRFLPAAAMVPLVLTVFALDHPAAALGSRPPQVAMGAYIPDSAEEPSLIDTYGSEVGGQPVIVSSYRDWTRPLIDSTELNAVWRRGAVPLITWEPWSQHDAGQTFPLAAIAHGRYDGFVEEAARAATAWGHPILLRFAHEMNGSWYPWGRGRDGNSPSVYKAAWRRIVSIFRADGADNVKWVWTPYVANGHRFPFVRYFPGNKWVDWAGLDGLNGGRVFGWRSFAAIFDDSYRQLIRITSRPLMLAEVGSTEEGGDKAAWLSRALRRAIPRMPHIRAIVWWADRGDYRGNFGVDSSSAALDALRTALARPEYDGSRTLLLSIRR
jgi:Glycosyl hydrolase family 26/LexA-binding, inner membrane-associated putative hydrolase